jgi:hypothetical protein
MEGEDLWCGRRVSFNVTFFFLVSGSTEINPQLTRGTFVPRYFVSTAMAELTADPTAKATAKGIAEAKINQRVSGRNRQQPRWQWQSIDGRLLIIPLSADGYCSI